MKTMFRWLDEGHPALAATILTAAMIAFGTSVLYGEKASAELIALGAVALAPAIALIAFGWPALRASIDRLERAAEIVITRVRVPFPRITGGRISVIRFALPVVVIGLALGALSSLPEFLSGGVAFLQKQDGVIISGAILGSNAINLGGILAISAIRARSGEFDFPWLSALGGSVLSVATWAVVFFGAPLWSAIALGVAAIAALGLIVWVEAREAKTNAKAVEEDGEPKLRINRARLMLLAATMILGIAVAALVTGTTTAAAAVSVLIVIPPIITALIIAAETSGPEALLSIPGAWNGRRTLAYVAVITLGSNIWNTLFWDFWAITGHVTGRPLFAAGEAPASLLLTLAAASVLSFGVLAAALARKIPRPVGWIVLIVTIAVAVVAAALG